MRKTNETREELEVRLTSKIFELEEEKNLLMIERNAIENCMHTLVHDLKNPLGNIIGFSDLLLVDGYSENDRLEFIKLINGVSNDMIQMIESYLLFQKFEASKGELVRKTKTVIDLVEGVRKITLKKYGENIIHIYLKKSEEHSVDPELFKKEIAVDPDLFYSAVTNLISNAVDASNRSAISIYIFEENNFFSVSISNKGEIPKEIQKNLFKKFNTGKKNGTGLGLFSSKRIAEAHGGDLIYEPLDGETKFILKVPFK